MNDSLSLILLFAAIVTIWMAASVVVVVFFTGVRHGRDEHDARVRRQIESVRALRDREADGRDAPVRVREDDRPLRLVN